MKKPHSQNSGREWNEKNPFPKFGKGNQRPPFLGMTGNGNGNNILFTFLDFFLPGSTLNIFSLTLCPKSFPDSATCIVTPKKIWDKNSM